VYRERYSSKSVYFYIIRDVVGFGDVVYLEDSLVLMEAGINICMLNMLLTLHRYMFRK
jgi:hypothetical protein